MEKPPRVLHVLSNLTTGGAELNTMRLSTMLVGRGFEQLVAGLTPQVDPALLSSLHVPLVYPSSKRRMCGVPYLMKIVREFRPHVIHGRGFRTWAACAWARSLSEPGMHLIQSFHGPASFDVHPTRRRLAAWWLAGCTDAFIAVGEHLANRLRSQWGLAQHRVHVVPNGVDVLRFQSPVDPSAAKARLNIPPQTFVLGTVGSLRKAKNHTLLLNAFAVFSESASDSLLLIVGDGPLRGSLEEQARRLGVAERVFFCGVRTDVQNFLAAMDVFVQPSCDEGSPTAVLEAMACGLPVVAARSGGCTELNAKTGLPLLVGTADPQALAQQLTALASDVDRRHRLGRQARAVIISSYTIEAMVAGYEHVYRSVVQNDQIPVRSAIA